MTARETSVETYHHLRDSGDLSEARWKVLEMVIRHGPGTSAEILRTELERNPRATLTQSRARFTELRDHGLLVELEPRPCAVTGRRAIVWALSGETEVRPLPPRRSRAREWRELAKSLADAFADKCRRDPDLVDRAALAEFRARIRELGGGEPANSDQLPAESSASRQQ